MNFADSEPEWQSKMIQDEFRSRGFRRTVRIWMMSTDTTLLTKAAPKRAR